jgi:HK97 family phage portal protein|tara:strand:+ start:2387 stop:3592 length:1206 start_codon:yes stop_codon:yes gene_type:complete
MAWYNNIFKDKLEADEKLNPAQRFISMDEGFSISTSEVYTNYADAYEQIEVVNRAVNLIVDDAAEIPVDVGQKLGLTPVVKNIRKSKVDLLLNVEPNPFQDINSFKRNLVIDLLIDGNIFVYFDGAHLYQLPARNVDIETDENTYVKYYTYNGKLDYSPSEIIHIKENSFNSIYRGVPRLKPAWKRMQLLGSMRKFQENFFKNGAVPGLVLKTPNTLSDKIKERMLLSWRSKYNPDTGGHRPLILDGGMEIDSLNEVNFKELDFQASIRENEKIILEAIGVPPILLDSGNNANIRPNHRLFYLETVLPIVRKINFGFERYFGFSLAEDVSSIPALQPELQDQASYYATLVNGGIMTPNEARVAMRMPAIPGNDDVRIPANIAGSAANPSEGGRPADSEGEE